MSKKYCINCGKLAPSMAKFCPACGAPQYGQAAGKFVAEAPEIKLENAYTNEGAQTMSVLGKTALADNDKEKIFKKFYNKTPLGSNAVLSFFFTYVAKTSILILLIIVGFVYNPLLSTLGAALYLFSLYITAYIVHKSFSFWVDDHSFHKATGIIHKQDVSIPYQQIQNVNINRSLTDRILGLSHISIETAGNNASPNERSGSVVTSSSEGYLPGVDLKTAKQLHDLLLTKADEAI